MSDINEVKGQAVEAGNKAYALWQKAKAFTAANPGTLLALAGVAFIVALFVL